MKKLVVLVGFTLFAACMITPGRGKSATVAPATTMPELPPGPWYCYQWHERGERRGHDECMPSFDQCSHEASSRTGQFITDVSSCSEVHHLSCLYTSVEGHGGQHDCFMSEKSCASAVRHTSGTAGTGEPVTVTECATFDR